MTRRAVAAGAVAVVALVGLVSGCSGHKPAPAPTGTASSSASSASSPSTSDSTALVRGLLSASAATRRPATPAALASVTLQPPAVSDPMSITVTRLDAEPQQTVLQLSAAMVNPGTSSIPQMFSPEASYEPGVFGAARSLDWVSVVDQTSKTRLFPYQYSSQPVPHPKLACVCMNEPLLRQQPQTWTLILPPLPSAATSVDVTIPKGFSDSSGLAEKAIATIKNVPVTRR